MAVVLSATSLLPLYAADDSGAFLKEMSTQDPVTSIQKIAPKSKPPSPSSHVSLPQGIIDRYAGFTPDQSIYTISALTSSGWSVYSFPASDVQHENGAVLSHGELPANPVLNFTPDSRWLIMTPTLGPGIQSLWIYRKAGDNFAPSSRKNLGQAAWSFFENRPESSTVHSNTGHLSATLAKGLYNNYRDQKLNLDGSHHLVIMLTKDTPSGHHVKQWHCLYNLDTGNFSVPPEFQAVNQKAIH